MKSVNFSEWKRIASMALTCLLAQSVMAQRDFAPVAPDFSPAPRGQALPSQYQQEMRVDPVAPKALPVEEAAENIPTAPLAIRRAPVQYRINDVARFLAGLPSLSENDSFSAWRHSLAWREHAKKLNGLWSQYQLRHEGKVRHWAEICMGNLRNSNAVFYPFSGPDFLFVNLLYPFANKYVMAGLETCDALPDFNALTDEELAQGLKALEIALDSVMQYSYFITKDMKQDFKSSRFGGVIPVFLVFMARSDQVVHGLDAVSLNAQGVPVTQAFTGKSAQGVCFRLQGNGVQKRVFYFTQNLSNDGCKPNGPFLNFVRSLGKPAGFLKSASYLSHESSFSNIRDFMLSHCRGLVQDPSGLPYRSLLNGGWNVHLFGNYQQTLEVFAKYEQPDLAQAYANPAFRAQAVDFSLGYLLDPKTTSIMLAWPR